MHGSGAIFDVVLADGQNYGDAFWSAGHSWADVFSEFTEDTFDLSVIFGTVSSGADATTQGAFAVSGANLTWTAVPEPTSALAGLLLCAGLLRRRRA